MIKRFKKCVLLTAALAVAVTGFAGCGKDIDGTATVAVCNEENIPMGVASLYTRYQQAQMFAFYGSYFGTTGMFDTVTDEESGETYGESMKGSVMDSLEEMYLLRQHASDYEVELSEEEKAAVTDAAKNFVEANEAGTLEKMGVSQADVETLLELYAYQTKMREAMIADVDKNVPDEEAAQSKITFVRISLAGTETDEDGNTIELTEEEKAAKKEQAQQVLDAIKDTGDTAAADMSALAKAVDENLSATTSTYGSEDESPDSALREAAAGLTDGQVSDEIITSSDGTALFVLRLDAAFDREATDTEKESIISQREQDDYTKEVDGWKEESKFEVKENQWKKISINDTDVYTYKAKETEDSGDADDTETTETPAETPEETPAE